MHKGSLVLACRCHYQRGEAVALYKVDGPRTVEQDLTRQRLGRWEPSTMRLNASSVVYTGMNDVLSATLPQH